MTVMTGGLTVLTGASRGLGEALLHGLVDVGERVLVLGRRLPESAASLPQDRLTWIACDFAAAPSWTEHEGVLRELSGKFETSSVSRLTFLHNAADVRPIGPIGALDAAQMLASIAINLSAPALIANACASWARAHGVADRVINVSSGAARRAIAGWASYCATKAAARMLFDVQAAEGRSAVIHVDPGVMDTGMQREIRATPADRFPDVDRFRRLRDDAKLADPVDVARTIVAEHYAATTTTGGVA